MDRKTAVRAFGERIEGRVGSIVRGQNKQLDGCITGFKSQQGTRLPAPLGEANAHFTIPVRDVVMQQVEDYLLRGLGVEVGPDRVLGAAAARGEAGTELLQVLHGLEGESVLSLHQSFACRIGVRLFPMEQLQVVERGLVDLSVAGQGVGVDVGETACRPAPCAAA
ncbi:MAG: hypothetical protein G8D58_09390 [gamma proteobacterium symbiont of Phacoides pectinatus]